MNTSAVWGTDWNRIEHWVFPLVFRWRIVGVMRRRSAESKTRTEEDYFRQFLDGVWPTEPVVKIYRIGSNGKQVCLDSLSVEMVKPGVLRIVGADNVLNHIRVQFGPGKYLLRTVYSNGRFGPSRVVHIG